MITNNIYIQILHHFQYHIQIQTKTHMHKNIYKDTYTSIDTCISKDIPAQTHVPAKTHLQTSISLCHRGTLYDVVMKSFKTYHYYIALLPDSNLHTHVEQTNSQNNLSFSLSLSETTAWFFLIKRYQKLCFTGFVVYWAIFVTRS